MCVSVAHEKEMADWERETFVDGFRVSDLREAFNAVHDPDDWRAPISVWVAGEHVAIVVAAIEYFTATKPRVRCDGRTDRIKRFLIESEGYRAGPAGDH